MFDVSHMRVVDLAGEGSRAFLRYALANNVDKLREPARRSTRACCARMAASSTTLIVYFLREDLFRLVVNAGTADKDIAWLRGLLAEHAPALVLTPRTDPRDGRGARPPRPSQGVGNHRRQRSGERRAQSRSWALRAAISSSPAPATLAKTASSS